MRHSFLDAFAHLDSPVHRLDARAKIIALFGLIIFSVLSNGWTAFAGYAGFLTIMILLSRVPLRHFARRALPALPFILLTAAFLPFSQSQDGFGPSREGWSLFGQVLSRAFLAVLAMALLSATTPFSRLMRGLEQLRAPRLLVMLASFAYRYIFVLVDEAGRMVRARDSRGYRGGWIWQARVIGQMIGVLFLRSYERAERVYSAMLSRGFDGHALAGAPARFRAADLAFTLFSLGTFVFIGGVSFFIAKTC